MRGDAVEVVGPEGAAAAADLPVRTVHEVVDDELAALAEEIREHFPAVLALEDVFLLDPLPRQVPALPAELITTTGELLFLGEKTRAGGDPVLVTHDSMFGHGALQWDYGSLVGLAALRFRANHFLRRERFSARLRRGAGVGCSILRSSISDKVAASTSNCCCQYLL